MRDVLIHCEAIVSIAFLDFDVRPNEVVAYRLRADVGYGYLGDGNLHLTESSACRAEQG